MQVTVLLIATPTVANSIEPVIRAVGWEAHSCSADAQALVAALRTRPNLIILEAKADTSAAAQLCRSIRTIDDLCTSPIFALTYERSDDRLAMLEAGADDCWVEPCDSREFLLRLHAVDRRLRPVRREKLVRLHGIELDPDRYTVRANGVPVQLTAMQLKVLRHFMEHPGVIFSRRELLDQVWGKSTLDEGAVTACIARIRRALAAAGSPTAIRSVRTTGGYVLELEAAAVANL